MKFEPSVLDYVISCNRKLLQRNRAIDSNAVASYFIPNDKLLILFIVRTPRCRPTMLKMEPRPHLRKQLVVVKIKYVIDRSVVLLKDS